MAIQLVCTPRSLPRSMMVAAAVQAVKVNPSNHPNGALVMRALGANPPREKIALYVGKNGTRTASSSKWRFSTTRRPTCASASCST